MPTMYDVCEKAGVSTATVSRVINNSPKVSEQTRSDVLEAMDKLGFQPNPAAQMLAGKRTETIGVILPEIDNGFYAQVLRGINDATRKNRKHLLTAFYDNEAGLKDTLMSLARPGRVDAVIVMNSSLPITRLNRLISGQVPMVLIGQRSETSSKFDIIGIDNEAGAREATEHLLTQGHQHILLITGPHHYLDSELRLKGVEQSYAQAGMDFSSVDQICGLFTFESGKEAMAAYLNTATNPPDAIFAFNDLMALGAIEAMKDHGIDSSTIPIIGFDGSELAKFANLSSVRVPMREIGYEAGTLANRRSKKSTVTPSRINLGTKLELR